MSGTHELLTRFVARDTYGEPDPPRPAATEVAGGARRRVERAGQEISLTPREYGLLEFLMHHRGDVTSKSAILAGVWDPAFEGDPNIVEVYILRLRRKIDGPIGGSLIQTRRGAGYCLDATEASAGG